MRTPKVLIISHNPFSSVRNNGKTLESIFSFFPKDCLSQLFFDVTTSPDFNYCNTYFCIPDIDVLKTVFFRRKEAGRVVCDENPTSNKNTIIHHLKTIRNKTWILKTPFFRDFVWKVGKWRSHRLYEWIESIKPDLVFFVGGPASFSNNIALEISKDFRLKMVTYYTDDYFFSIDKKSLTTSWQYDYTLDLYRKTIRNSILLYVIGEKMAKVYSAFFSRTFYPIMNSVEIPIYENYKDHDKIVISYFGGLQLKRWKMIVEIASMLPHNTSLIVYSHYNTLPYKISKAFREVGVFYAGMVSGDQLNRKMRNSDILLHVESNIKDIKEYTALSVSTKIPEYLSTGRPVIGYGPLNIASMELLSNKNVGFTISCEDDYQTKKNKLFDIISNYQKRKEIGLRGYKYAEQNFDRKKNASVFMKQMINIAGSDFLYGEDV